MNELISEFFYEGIRRIVPGFFVIALYYHKEVVTAFDAHHAFFFVMLNACILLIAWVIGFMIEQIMNIPLAFLAAVLKNEFGLKYVDKQTNQSLKPDKDHEREKRRQHYLRFAEKILCRSLWPIFLFAVFFAPEPFSNFPNVQCDSRNGIAILILITMVFLVTWLWMAFYDYFKTDFFDFLLSVLERFSKIRATRRLRKIQ